MIIQTWTETFVTSMQGLWVSFVNLVPVIVGAFVVFVFGWIIASVFGRAVTRLAKAAQLDKLFNQLGVMKHVRKAGLEWEVSGFLGGLVEWFFIIVAFLAAIDLLGLSQLSSYIRDILVYIPNVIVAALILMVAAVVANFLEKLIKASLKATDVGPARFVGSVVRWSVWVFAALAALNQLGIAKSLIEILFMGFVAMLAIAGGLAFGLGGKDVAHDMLEAVKRDVTGRE
ncbi:MAG: hypothetical protein R3251_00600 [Candidatus Spechtbacterales bacterium]|nr:hypothetical protein [Candidatus Spechtbacterales bacterium]